MNHPEVIIIAALAASNRVIGKNGKLPWSSIPEDSQRFKRLTLGHPVIMGRKTWEHDIEMCPLVERCNIVISSSPQVHAVKEHCQDFPFGLTFVTSLDEALAIATQQDPEKVFIVGGASIYALALDIADTLELTLVDGSYTGDTFFPEYEHLIQTQFKLVNQEDRPGYRFETYQRI
jgi:dihydrofolate reductase